MSQPESRLSKQIMAHLRLQGWFCFKVHGSEFMMAGLPDIIVCAEGLFVGLEVKMPNSRGDVSPIQRRVHQLITEAHGSATVVCSVAEAVGAVRDALAMNALAAARLPINE
jgi:Holliday junction resolvase